MTHKEQREEIMSDEDRITAWQRKNRRCIYCYGERLIETITDRLFGCCNRCAERDNNTQIIKQSLPCVCCGKELQAGAGWGDQDEITVQTVDHQGFGDGMATNISAGFGSTLDCNVYMIAICDDCARQKQKEGRLTYVYNYMP